jgi:hypothetical protein
MVRRGVGYGTGGAKRGHEITVPIIVLDIYVVVGVILVTIFSWGRLPWWRGSKRRPDIVRPEDDVGTAAIPPG